MSLKEEPERAKSERAHSPAPSYMSLSSDWSIEPPTNFKSRETFHLDLRAASPAPSYMSLRTDWSMEPPTNFKIMILDTRYFSVEPPAIYKAEDTFPLDSRLVMSHHLRCPVCKSILKDPVSIFCGHSYCRGCISEFWDNCAGDYLCPQCGNSSETRPVLNSNAALAVVVKTLQQSGFSPALPPQSYAGPKDVACDFCTEQRLKAVKCCLTCDASFCETHIRQHYTVPALQKHTLSDVTGDMKTKSLQQCQNSDDIFSSIITKQQDQEDETQDIIKEEVWSISESVLNACTSETAVNKDDTDDRSLALLCSKLQEDVSALEKSISELKEKKAEKEKEDEEEWHIDDYDEVENEDSYTDEEDLDDYDTDALIYKYCVDNEDEDDYEEVNEDGYSEDEEDLIDYNDMDAVIEKYSVDNEDEDDDDEYY
ncbi:uncharacterized protein [Garra rufa]|uniref:uncharacterized protein n=1 Tax=Garra rufa TaxID=137080 RepID=UPI003CCEEE6F